MQRDGIFWGVGVSKAAVTITLGRAAAPTGTTSVCPAGPRNRHPQRSHTVSAKAWLPTPYREPSLALSTPPWKPIWSPALRLCPARGEKTLDRQGLAAGPSPTRQGRNSKGPTTKSQGWGLLIYPEGCREARLVPRRARQQAEAPEPAVTISQHEPGCVRTSLDHTQPFCFIIIRLRGTLCFQIKETHSSAYHRWAAMNSG